MLREILEGMKTDKELMKLILNNFGDNKFGKKGVMPEYSKKHSTMRYEAPSKIKGIVFSTSWEHQKDYFDIEIDTRVSKANSFMDNLKEFDLPDSISQFKGQYADFAIIRFEDDNKYTKRLIGEFADSFYGFSQEDLV